jgi:hypothetical protein
MLKEVIERHNDEEIVKNVLHEMIKKLERAERVNNTDQPKKLKPASATPPIKFSGRQTKPAFSWGEKCTVIYFHLHPNLGNNEMKLTCDLFKLKRTTVSTWLNNAKFVQKWRKVSSDECDPQLFVMSKSVIQT